MKRTKAEFTVIVVSLFLMLAFGTAAHAVQAKKIDASKIQTTRKPLQQKLSSDVSVSFVEFFNCPCQMALDVYYVDQFIGVKLFNESMLSPTVKLTVKYFDVLQNRVNTIVKNVTFSSRGSKKVVIMNHQPLLIKKSYGVHAEVAHTAANMVDPDMSNNSADTQTCGPMVE